MDFKDLIIVLPGITGSVLQKDGKDVWAGSRQAVVQAIRTRFRSLSDLKLGGATDSDDLDLGDGVVASRVIDDITILPGLMKVDGYSGLRKRIREQFNIIHGDLNNDSHAANYIEFPYDWRRDNRISARKLKQLIDKRLPLWREKSGNKNAKVILIGHSMGGLISRYYLEALGGWRDCKLLVTFGTPFSGSLNAIDSLSNGNKRVGIDVTDIVRSLPSAYQLMPRYPVLRSGDKWLRVTETDAIPNVSRAQAGWGFSFTQEIDAAIKANESEDGYEDKYRMLPVVGTHQTTWQSAEIVNNRLVLRAGMPNGWDRHLANGDGTVPRISAVPPEIADQFPENFQTEKHASIQNNSSALDQLIQTLISTQNPLAGLILGKGDEKGAFDPLLTLEVEDLYLSNEPILLRVSEQFPDQVGDLEIEISGDTSRKISVPVTEEPSDVLLEPLPEGLYRVKLSAPNSAADPVHDVFAVG